MQYISIQVTTSVGSAYIEVPVAYQPATLTFTGADWDQFTRRGPFLPDDRIVAKLHDAGWPSIKHANRFFINVPQDRIQVVLDPRVAGFVAARALEVRKPLLEKLTTEICHATDVADAVILLRKKSRVLQTRALELIRMETVEGD